MRDQADIADRLTNMYDEQKRDKETKKFRQQSRTPSMKISQTMNSTNKMLRRTGQFWMEDYFDRYIRDAQHFSNTVKYIENNPVKARLCTKPEDWPYSSAWFRVRQKK